ncbi:M1 family metallopeptidase [Candidatus Solirubrobacter pratensis]|uniref:M1 family metallopeptidase n=1 Tax=Candidatus Solirubrobacter pratensis TaxID=1298857 RepID=UPI00040100A9|nr:M1 family metallopeptidase [Candidatus Solirubrobacter pratensis]
MRGFFICLAALMALALPASASASQRPSPGSAGIGDRLFPTLGNGGYDVQHYDLDLRYATASPAQGIDGTVTILARATQSLSRFDLDFAGDSVGSVSVNGRAATFARDGEELVITPRAPLPDGRAFVVQVSHYTAHPREPDPNVLLSTAFFTTPDGSATAGQPDSTHVFLPSNDHPRDKASFTIRFDVPAGTTAIANGVKVSQTTSGGRTRYAFLQRQPMATELLQLAVGRYDTISRGVHDGIIVRDAIAPSLATLLSDKLPTELTHLDWMKDHVGDYPFDAYGSLVVDATLGFALETQTLSLFDKPWFDGTYGGRGIWEPTMVHELSHMWFGDSVAPYSWDDVWLNEGHATWYEWSWAAEHGELGEDIGIPGFDDTMRAVYNISDLLRAEDGPVGRPLSGEASQLFSVQVYWGGALVLYALRQQIGDAAFQRLERAWVSRHRDGVASTQDFIALASKVSGQDLTAFLNDWVYGTKTPPMPGHPDWTVAPAGAGARTLAAPQQALLARAKR